MSGTILQLRSHEVWSALEVVDPVATMAEYLIGRAVHRAGHGHRSPGSLSSWNGTGRNGTELVLLDHPDATGPCVMPAQSLRNAQAAAMATVAARELVVPGGVTMAVLGPADDTQPQLSVLARQVPDISHVALCGSGEVDPKLADRLELSGIGLSVVPTSTEAVFGANLVVVSNTASARHVAGLRIEHFARGALLVNTTGQDLPASLMDEISDVYVDDLGLLERYPKRRFAMSTAGAGQRRRGVKPRIAGDLAQLLTDRHQGLRDSGEIVLVDLLGTSELNADLAYRIHEVAIHLGLGVRIVN